MAKKKTIGVVKVGDRKYAIDHVAIINGERVHIRKSGFTSAQEARDALPKIIEKKKMRAGAEIDIRDFNDLMDRYFDFRGLKIKPQTMLGLKGMMERHALPYFDGEPVNEALTLENVRRWYRIKVADKTMSNERKNDVFTEMRGIIERAWRWKCIDSEDYQDLTDLVRNIAVEKKAKQEVGVWTYDQVNQFLEAIPEDNIDRPMFTLFCYLGCRIGEFLGLQWKCFDEEHRAIAICQQIIKQGSSIILTSELKTNESYRVNELDDETFDLLMRYRATLNTSNGDEYIFPSPRDTRTPLSKTEFRRKFYRYTDAAGLPKIVPHGIRHSKATELASVCEDTHEMAVAAKFLGHSPSMFIDTYVNTQNVTQSDLLKRLKRA